MHKEILPRCQIRQIDRYQIRTVNIRLRFFSGVPFLISTEKSVHPQARTVRLIGGFAVD